MTVEEACNSNDSVSWLLCDQSTTIETAWRFKYQLTYQQSRHTNHIRRMPMSIKAARNIIKPGEIVPDSGIYQDISTGQRSTLVKGEHAPPTQLPDSAWKQVIATHPDNG
jgi:hypothetical protein